MINKIKSAKTFVLNHKFEIGLSTALTAATIGLVVAVDKGYLEIDSEEVLPTINIHHYHHNA